MGMRLRHVHVHVFGEHCISWSRERLLRLHAHSTHDRLAEVLYASI